MDIAGAARLTSALRRARTGSAMRELTAGLLDRLGRRARRPSDVRELCRALCEEMTVRRGGRRVEVRFERFPDEIEVTGLWVEFEEFDLIIVEERAEEVQQLVILGHELWHLHARHRHRHTALDALSGWEGVPLTAAARDGSREVDEAEADNFGHRLAAAVRGYLGPGGGEPGPGTAQRLLGYHNRRGGRGR
ncbi:toxin-antitoxin system, toxin component family protein [Streptomyces roseirectus]|uniref:Toxin-antitoxin system, toxin component family protein n=1 Tax=Streptomyces roseirectus TaxID=2768066 RepID=A0A7H0IJD5_9ACTN|nr:toxin-antitoxin system, toxin component family protein [Streptomyces roseirectus]QNP72901.1 toxin-antitoxin system, toxin component family protein [Streptomyces roseirectus]